MMPLELSEVQRAMEASSAAPLRGSVSGVSIDSRALKAGDLFFALRGAQVDGHAFVADALARGAAGAVVSDAYQVPGATPRGVLLRVADPLTALARLARYHRAQHPARVIAVVGSNGKTTTKEMLAHVLGGRWHTRCSPKSFNNALGVPLTLLSAATGDDILVAEIGSNAPGEIAALANLVRPDMAVLTCIAEEHLAGFGDLAGVAAEECAVLRFVAEGGFAAVNVEAAEVLPHLQTREVAARKLRLVTFGDVTHADLRVTAAQYAAPWLAFEINGVHRYRLHSPGLHNAWNACAAIAVALRLGMSHEDIAERLLTFVAPPMRAEVLQLGGVTLINDAYNSNPHSALAALTTLDNVAGGGRRVVVFGEMRELGRHSAALHRRVAQRLREHRVDHVLLVGPAAEYMYDALKGGDLFCPTVERCDDVDDAGLRLRAALRSGDVVLLKASRTVGLERIIQPLRDHLAAAAAAAAAVHPAPVN